ncbi:ATP-binding domain-containing protein [Arthrobacter sp. TB 23]|uniref:ATP-binding domain-containing protein n=1 Tax=Arthrobacter sp. TB 23 TaxID=494419 RepID=UPI0002EE41ED|nr:ATP-binding domain-containing protein [Arthrobacter sp. TB 23]
MVIALDAVLPVMVQLRLGNTEVIDAYQSHQRIQDGDTDVMLDTAYAAWRTDLSAGKASVLIAETHDVVSALNTRARLDLLIAGHVADTGEMRLHDGTGASKGDLVITRRNDRRLPAGRGWVKNGDRWTVIGTNTDGSVTVRRAGHRLGSSVVLPAGYVAKDLELAYAVTAHRAQGLTVDTVHAVVHGSTMTRETLYVAMTRGREANTAYVATDHPDDTHQHPHPDDQGNTTALAVLSGVLSHVGGELSAHEMIEAEQETWSNIAQLAAEYETIAASAQHERWVGLIERSGLSGVQVDEVVESEAFGALTAELRRAEANQRDVDTLLPRLVAARRFDDADDIAAVLHTRLGKTTNLPTGSSRPRQAPRLIAGLIPEATGPMADEMRQALAERAILITERAHALAQAAVIAKEPWIAGLGQPPIQRGPLKRWQTHAATIAAYRDRYGITENQVLPPQAATAAQNLDQTRAKAALKKAQALAQVPDATQRDAPTRGQNRSGMAL